VARQLLEGKALWNSFIFAATGAALLSLLRTRMAVEVEEMATALARDGQAVQPSALVELYERLPTVDFSRDVVQEAPHALRVIAAPACGWNDLGTPRRVAETLRRVGATAHDGGDSGSVRHLPRIGLINLAAEHARLAIAG